LWQNQPSLIKTVIVEEYNIEAFLVEASMMIKDGLQRESNKMEIRSKTELQKTLDPTENQYKKTITPEDAARAHTLFIKYSISVSEFPFFLGLP
jgi:hypothetical protein